MKILRNPARPTQREALKAAEQLRAAVVHLRRELKGCLLVTAILIDRAGGKVTISQADMLGADGWQLKQGFNPKGEFDSDATWVFRIEKPVQTPEDIEFDRVSHLSPEEFDAEVRAKQAAADDDAREEARDAEDNPAYGPVMRCESLDDLFAKLDQPDGDATGPEI